MDLTVLGISAALLSAASWALGAILFKQLGESLSSFAMTLVKGALSVLLLAVAIAVCELLSRFGLDVTGFEAIGFTPLMVLALSGILGIAVADTCFFEALRELGPHSLVLLQTVGLILTPLGAVVFLGESRTPIEWFGIGLIVAGVTFVLYVNLSSDEQGGAGWRGLLFGLLSVFCMSASFIIAKPALESVSAIEATLIRMAAGTLGLLLLGLVTGRLGAWVVPLKDAGLAGRFLVAVCVVTFGGFWLSLLAMKHLDVSMATPLISTEPLFVLPLAALMLKEKITWRALAGTVATIAGIALLCWGAAGGP